MTFNIGIIYTESLFIASYCAMILYRSIEDITVEEWLAIAAFTLVFVGIVACTWIVVLWCICRIELTYRKNEVSLSRSL